MPDTINFTISLHRVRAVAAWSTICSTGEMMGDGKVEFLSILAPSARPQAPNFRTTIDRIFESCLFLLVVTGFVTLASTGRLDALSVVAVSAALAVRGYLLLRGRAIAIPERWTSYLTLVYVLFYAADYFLISGSYVTATVHLVLFGMVVKVFSVQRERDHVYLAILSFLEVLAASVLTVDTIFLGAFCVFLLLAVATFIAMEMRRSAAAAGAALPPPPIPRAHLRLTQSVSVAAVVMVLAIVAGGAAIFFILPRLSAGYLSAYAPRNEFVSGFSDRVQLGEIGRIKQSDTVVMHIEVQSGPRNLADIKWRGIALSHFDGRVWTNPGGDIESYAPLASGRFDLLNTQVRMRNAGGDPAELRRTSQLLVYRVTMEPIGTNAIFLASVPAMLQSRIREIGVDSNGSVLNIDRSRMTESYTAVSLLPRPAIERLRAGGTVPPDVVLTHQQLPRLDLRVRALAEEITAKAATPYEKAMAIETYLRTRYTYSLQMAVSPPADPIAYFLFERKQGHCEYFASTMTVMLRVLGIPARVVNGFRTGEYNDITGSYIIRGRDAHSWVEAYIPGYAWVSFDPTPPDPAVAVGGFHRVSLYLDALGEFWREWVINYDFLHQQTLTTSTVIRGRSLSFRAQLWLRRKYVSMLAGAARAYRRGAQAGPWEIGLLMALIAAPFLLRALMKASRERSLARNPQHAPRMAASLWYTRLLQRLARQGIRKQPAQTPSEFVASITDPPLRAKVGRFTAHYQRARFGQSADDARELPRVFQEITAR